MAIRNTKWVVKRNEHQQAWIRHYLVKNHPSTPLLKNYSNEVLSKLVSDGDLISDEVRLKMESAWRSYLSRQKKKMKSIAISSSAYKEAKLAAEAKGMTVRGYIEHLIGSQLQKPTSKPVRRKKCDQPLPQEFTKPDGVL